MADLAKKLESMNNGFAVGIAKINSLFWADDIVLLAESGSLLTKMIDTVSDYCAENKLTINSKKTKCLIFNKSSKR